MLSPFANLYRSNSINFVFLFVLLYGLRMEPHPYHDILNFLRGFKLQINSSFVDGVSHLLSVFSKVVLPLYICVCLVNFISILLHSGIQPKPIIFPLIPNALMPFHNTVLFLLSRFKETFGHTE